MGSVEIKSVDEAAVRRAVDAYAERLLLHPPRRRGGRRLPLPVGAELFPFPRDEIAALEPSPLLDVVRASQWRYRR